MLFCYHLYRKNEKLSEQLVLFKKTEVWLEAAFLVLWLTSASEILCQHQKDKKVLTQLCTHTCSSCADLGSPLSTSDCPASSAWFLSVCPILTRHHWCVWRREGA